MGRGHAQLRAHLPRVEGLNHEDHPEGITRAHEGTRRRVMRRPDGIVPVGLEPLNTPLVGACDGFRAEWAVLRP